MPVRRPSPIVGHAARTEHLAAHVVAVRGLEAGLGDARRRRCRTCTVTTAVSSRPAVAPVRLDQRVRGGVHLDGLRAGVEEPQRVEVVDQRLVEDRVRRHPGRVEPARVAGHRPQQPRRAQRAVVEQRARRSPVRGEPAVEPDLQHYSGGAGGVDRPVQVGQRQRHRLLAEHGLAGPRPRRRSGRRGTGPVRRSPPRRPPGRRRPAPGRCTAETAPNVAASFSAAPGAGSATAASRAPGSRCASVAPWKAPIRPDPIRATPTVALALTWLNRSSSIP